MTQVEPIQPLQALVATVRPDAAQTPAQAGQRLLGLAARLAAGGVAVQAEREAITQWLTAQHLRALLTQTGITQGLGFWGAARQRLGLKLLPPPQRPGELADHVAEVFDQPGDAQWLMAHCGAVAQVLQALAGGTDACAQQLRAWAQAQALEALAVLSLQVAALAFEPEVQRKALQLASLDGPFQQQLQAQRDYAAQRTVGPAPIAPQLQALDACELQLLALAQRCTREGVSVALTRLMLRARQCIARMRALLAVLQHADPMPAAARLLAELVAADARKSSLRDLLDTNTATLALQVTESASRTGEHYVTTDRAGWLAMLRSALGAGAIVGVMALAKLLLSGLALAPAGVALVYGLNYAGGFVLVYLLHFTIATKQPAMTAALIAQALDRGRERVQEVADLVVHVLRSQFIAVLGNVAVALPTALVIGLAWAAATGMPLAGPDKLAHLLHDLDPVHSLAVPHAAIAGICLFLSGLVAGFYDNRAADRDLAGRMRRHPGLRAALGPERLDRLAIWTADNLGGLASNVALGFMLGGMGVLGAFLGLPLDIRHVTFASGNLGFAIAAAGDVMTWQQWLASLAGLVLIGLVNLAVSFSLALAVALRSRRVALTSEWTIASVVLGRLRRNPREFFLPPREPASTASA